MIAVDTNILVYAHRAESAFHDAAYLSIQTLAEGNKPWGIPVACLHEFLSIATNPNIFSPASTYEQALSQVEAWLASPTAQVLLLTCLTPKNRFPRAVKGNLDPRIHDYSGPGRMMTWRLGEVSKYACTRLQVGVCSKGGCMCRMGSVELVSKAFAKALRIVVS